MTTTFGGAGQGINFFYPSGNLWPFLVALLFVKNPVHAIFLGTILRTFVGLVSSFVAMRVLNHRSIVAIVFSVTYCFSTYLLYNAIPRFDLGETMAILFLPLVFASFYKILISKNQDFGLDCLFAFSLALLTYAHLLTTVFTFLLLFILSVIFLLAGRTVRNVRKILIQFLSAALCYTFLTIGFWLPFVSQLVSTRIAHPELPYEFGVPSIADPSLSQIFNLSLSNHLQNNGVTLGILALIGVFALFIHFNHLDNKTRFIFILGLFLLLLSTDIFPWALFENTPISVIQMPSRFMPFANLFLIYAIILMEENYLSRNDVHRQNFYFIILSAIPIILAAGSSTIYFHQQREVPVNKKGENIAYIWSKRINGSANWYGESGPIYDDYLPTASGSIKQQVDKRQILVNGAPLGDKSVSYYPITNGMIYKFDSEKDLHDVAVTLPFWTYNKRNYMISVNHSKNKIPEKSRVNVASIITNLKEGENEVTVRFVAPNSYKISGWVSIISMIVMPITIIFNKFSSKTKVHRKSLK
ncbi:6-pyruvoyl-tetrahydropterin synthase-related protein [Leuconostocaceae bacterium ESL0723]|nr:6-pyruvoyl-tetrahydropterin synthase-related protein [Leuconostocaceae bacterium ESL0723]